MIHVKNSAGKNEKNPVNKTTDADGRKLTCREGLEVAIDRLDGLDLLLRYPLRDPLGLALPCSSSLCPLDAAEDAL